MARFRTGFVILILALAIPAVASAHRWATKAERAAVLAAVVHQGGLSSAQAACQTVAISTVNRSYAAVTWPAKMSKACIRVAANGIIVEHHKGSQWVFVAVGSAFHCPVKGIPNNVARDFGLCH